MHKKKEIVKYYQKLRLDVSDNECEVVERAESSPPSSQRTLHSVPPGVSLSGSFFPSLDYISRCLSDNFYNLLVNRATSAERPRLFRSHYPCPFFTCLDYFFFGAPFLCKLAPDKKTSFDSIKTALMNALRAPLSVCF